MDRADLAFLLPGVAMPSWIVRYDEAGACTSHATEDALFEALKAADAPDSIVFMSHGWNTDFADATGQYAAFLKAFEQVARDHPPRSGLRPLFVGVTWPSVWFPFDRGPAMAAAVPYASPADALAVMLDRLDDAPAARFRELMAFGSLDARQAEEAALIALPLVGADDEQPHPGEDLTAADLVAGAAGIQGAFGGMPEIAAGTLDFGRLGVVRAAGLPAMLDPLNLLRLLSLYQIKDRAGTVGSAGVADLLRRLLSTALPIHVVGHSFGAKVMLSALCAGTAPTRKANSFLLLQPAISHLAFASSVPGRPGSGGYAGAFDRVVAPILSTFSRADFPLHDVFHLALRRLADLGEARIAAYGEPPSRFAALGGYGPRGAGEMLGPIHAPGEPYSFEPAVRIVGLDGSMSAADGKARIACHGCVANPFTAWALLQQIAGS